MSSNKTSFCHNGIEYKIRVKQAGFMDYSKQAKQAKKLLRKALEKNTEKPKKLKYAKAPDIPKPDHVTEQNQ